MISERLFEALPPEERRYWHSHKHEVHVEVDAHCTNLDEITLAQILDTNACISSHCSMKLAHPGPFSRVKLLSFSDAPCVGGYRAGDVWIAGGPGVT